ncbi:unnamed protein product, partial [Dibothriocephalus latus]
MNYILTAPRVRPVVSDQRSKLEGPQLRLVNGRADVGSTTRPVPRSAVPTIALRPRDLDNPASSPAAAAAAGQSPFPETTRLS